MDAENYVTNIAGQAKAYYMFSHKVVGRECQIEALMQAMSKRELILVLGGKNLGKTLLKNEAIHRWADRKDKINFLSVDMRDASLIGRSLMGALDWQRQTSLEWTTRRDFRTVVVQALLGRAAYKARAIGTGEAQINIENFINETIRSGRIPSIVVDAADLAIPGLSGEPNTAAKAALVAITKWTKETKQANFMLISSEFGYPFRLMECGLDLRTIGKVIVIGEVPKDDMLQMLKIDWGMDDNLANIFYDYFGGDIYTTTLALDNLIREKEKFDPSDIMPVIGLPSCVEDPDARPHLENIAKQGFSFVEDAETDAGARLIAEQNVGGLIDSGAITFDLPDIFTGTDYQWAVIPSSYHMRWLIARKLHNIPLPTSGLLFSFIL